MLLADIMVQHGFAFCPSVHRPSVKFKLLRLFGSVFTRGLLWSVRIDDFQNQGHQDLEALYLAKEPS